LCGSTRAAQECPSRQRAGETNAAREWCVTMRRGVTDLEWVLDHELLQAKRHRRFVSLAMVKSSDPALLRNLRDVTMRESDIFFEFSDNFGAILMSETCSAGAVAAVDRYKKSCQGQTDLRFGVGCFPEDNQAVVPGFVSMVYQRLRSAETQAPGTVIASG